MTLRIETSTDRWARMIRSTGVVGLITIAVLFAREWTVPAARPR
jgi:hypothetical protein